MKRIKRPDTIVAEIHGIRKKLYEREKDFSLEERVKRTNARGRRLAKEYGFEFATPKSA